MSYHIIKYHVISYLSYLRPHQNVQTSMDLPMIPGVCGWRTIRRLELLQDFRCIEVSAGLGLKAIDLRRQGALRRRWESVFFWCRMATPHEIHEDVDGMKMKIVKCVMIHMVFDWVLYDWIVSNDNGDDWENTWDNNDAIPSSIIKHG